MLRIAFGDLFDVMSKVSPNALWRYGLVAARERRQIPGQLDKGCTKATGTETEDGREMGKGVQAAQETTVTGTGLATCAWRTELKYRLNFGRI